MFAIGERVNKWAATPSYCAGSAAGWGAPELKLRRMALLEGYGRLEEEGLKLLNFVLCF